MKLKMSPNSTIKARLGLEHGGKAHKKFTLSCARHMDKYVPKNTGMLRANVDIGTDRIVYKSPYARYQYYGKMYVDKITGKGAFFSEDYGFWSRPNTQKEKTTKNLSYHVAGTGSYWDKKMKSAEMDKVIKEVQEYVERGCK